MAIIECIGKTKKKTYKAMIRASGKQLTKTFKRKVDAEMWATDIKYQKQNGHMPGKARFVSLDEVFEHWMTQYCEEKNVTGYVNMCRRNYKNWIKPHLGHYDFRKVTSADIEVIGQHLSASKRSESTANRIFSLLRKIYNDCQKKRWFGELRYKPTDGIDFYSEINKSFDYWSRQEVANFLAYAKQHANPTAYVVYTIAVNCGLRAGEIFALSPDDIDLNTRELTVSKSVEFATRTVVERTKNKRTRYLGINDDLAVILKNWLAHVQQSPQSAAGKHSLLFPNARGEVFTYRNFIRDNWVKDLARSGARKIRFHDLRHTYASTYMQAGGMLYDLQKLMGHCDMKTTQRYAHLEKEHLISKAQLVRYSDDPVQA